MNGIFDVSAVALGGAIGALFRWSLAILASAIPGGSPPWGTTVANVIGCGLMGLFVVFTELDLTQSSSLHHSPRAQLAIRVGLIGSITTFSTFIAEAVAMWQIGQPTRLAVYLAANTILGLAAFLIVSTWARFHAM